MARVPAGDDPTVITSDLPLPVSVEAVDARWLTAALSTRYPGVQVVSLRQESLLHGTATKIRVELQYNDVGHTANLPRFLCVKGGFSEHRELMAFIYELEARFFRDVAPRLDLCLPRCYYAGTDRQTAQSIVVLEDLVSRGVTFCRTQTPLNWDQAAANLDAQARYHALWWNSPLLQRGGEFDWIEALDPFPDPPIGAYHHRQLADYASYMGLPRGAAVSRVFHDAARMGEAMQRLREVDRKGPISFLHGDAHIGNLYIDVDGAPGFLDWQAIRTGPWAHDVTYFIVSALDMSNRRHWEKSLLAYYLERLSAYGVAAPSFENAWLDYLRQVIYGLFFWLVNPVQFQAEVNNCAVAARFALAALDHDVLDLLGV